MKLIYYLENPMNNINCTMYTYIYYLYIYNMSHFRLPLYMETVFHANFKLKEKCETVNSIQGQIKNMSGG